MKTCTRCDLTKPFEEFGASRLGRDGRSSWCRPCFQAYNRGYQQRKRQIPAVKAAERAYAADHREALNARNRKYLAGKQKWIDSLKGAPCQDCGGRFPPCSMDFDHVRGEKFKPISSLWGYSREVTLKEIAKCELVCANCHRVRTETQRANPDNRKATAKLFYVRVWALKSGPCTDCGGCFHPASMDFDHVLGEKMLDLAQMSQVRWARVLVELAKCELVCANCHRIRTVARRRVV